jgi:hypothetical protein
MQHFWHFADALHEVVDEGAVGGHRDIQHLRQVVQQPPILTLKELPPTKNIPGSMGRVRVIGASKAFATMLRRCGTPDWRRRQDQLSLTPLPYGNGHIAEVMGQHRRSNTAGAKLQGYQGVRRGSQRSTAAACNCSASKVFRSFRRGRHQLPIGITHLLRCRAGFPIAVPAGPTGAGQPGMPYAFTAPRNWLSPGSAWARGRVRSPRPPLHQALESSRLLYCSEYCGQ